MKRYYQYCGLAKALDVVGERWTLLIVRDLLLGPRRYSQLLEGLKGITTNLLAQRLKQLRQAGLLEKEGEAYRLTSTGLALEPALLELACWGGLIQGEWDGVDRLDLGWALISSKRRYRARHPMRVEIRLAGWRTFALVCGPDGLAVREQPCPEPDLVLAGEELALLQLLFRGSRAGVHVLGDRLPHFLENFGLDV